MEESRTNVEKYKKVSLKGKGMKRTLGIILIFVCLAMGRAEGSKSQEGDAEKGARMFKECTTLSNQYFNKKYLSPTENMKYCHNECAFIPDHICAKKVTSRIAQEVAGVDIKMMVAEYAVEWMMYVDSLIKGEIPKKARLAWFESSVEVDTYVRIITMFGPYMSVFFPMIVKGRYGKEGEEQIFKLYALNFFYVAICVAMFYDLPKVMIHNFGMTLMITFGGMHTKGVSGIFLGYFLMIGVFVGSLVTQSYFVQSAMAVMAIMMMFLVMKETLIGKGGESKFTIIYQLVQFAVMLDLFQIIQDEFSSKSSGVAMMKVAVLGALGYGDETTLFLNDLRCASDVARTMGSVDLKVLGVFWFAMMVYICAFLWIRIFIGCSVMHAVKFKMDYYYFFWGLYSYMIDIYMPAVQLFRMTFGSEKFSSRKFWYCVVMMMSLAGEVSYCGDFFALRVFLMFIEYAYLDTGLSESVKYLDGNVDCSGQHYPKNGCFPWSCLDMLNKVAENAVVVHGIVGTDEGNAAHYVATGLITVSSEGQPSLVTVKHVVDAVRTINVGDLSIKAGTAPIEFYGTSDDPVAVVKLSKLPKDNEGVVLPFLLKEEVKNVSYLASVGTNKMFCVMTDFKVDRGDIAASVALTGGDSGTVVVAVLANGTTRLAGVVSRGSTASGSLNLLSSVVGGRQGPQGGSELGTFFDVRAHDETALRVIARINAALEAEASGCYDEDDDKYDADLKKVVDSGAAERSEPSQAEIEAQRKIDEEEEKKKRRKAIPRRDRGGAGPRSEGWIKHSARRDKFKAELGILLDDQSTEYLAAMTAFEDKKVICFNARRGVSFGGVNRGGIGFVAAKEGGSMKGNL